MPLADIFTLSLALAALIGFGAGVMKGFSGFGAGMIMAPLLSLLYTPVEGVAIIILIDLISSVQMLPGALPRTNWRLVVPMMAASFVAAPFAALVLFTTDVEIMRRVIGGTVLFFALVMLSGWRYRGAQRPAISLLVGALTGLLAGGTGMGAPIVVLYVLSNQAGAARNRASMLTLSTGIVSYLLFLFILNDAINSTALWRAGVLAPVMILGTWAGARLFSGASEGLFRRVALLSVLAVGAAAVVA